LHMALATTKWLRSLETESMWLSQAGNHVVKKEMRMLNVQCLNVVCCLEEKQSSLALAKFERSEMEAAIQMRTLIGGWRDSFPLTVSLLTTCSGWGCVRSGRRQIFTCTTVVESR
jgi:hypothetical protein